MCGSQVEGEAAGSGLSLEMTLLPKADGSHCRLHGEVSMVWPKILDSSTGTDMKKFSLRPETGRP